MTLYKKWIGLFRFAIVLTVLAWFASCSQKPTGSTETPVILITLDTLRSDHLPLYGHGAINTPALKSFRQDAVLFERAYAHSALTLPSHATILTGRLPANHGVRDNTGYVLEESALTLAERLKREGYATGAAVSSMVLRRSTGIAQGFDFYDDDFSVNVKTAISEFAQRRGDRTLAVAKQWFAKPIAEPEFFWLHLYDPHTPYTPPKPYAATYDGEIAFTDSLLLDFFRFLKDEGLYRKALIIIASDHGEGLGDHGEEEHGMLLYRESIQVPLLIKFPDNRHAGGTIERPVGLADIHATIEETLGLKPSESDGISLARAEEPPANRTIFAESLFPLIHYGWHAQKSVIQRELHLIEGYETEVYDMVLDPAERKNLFGQVRVPPVMFEVIEQTGEDKQSTAQISEEDQAMLESLGYTGSFQFGDDVKSLTFEELNALRDKILVAQHDLNESRFDKVEADMLALLQTNPTFQEAKSLLGLALKSLEKYDQAEHLLMESLVSSPNDYSLLTSLAEVKIKQEKWTDALMLAQKAVPLEPSYAGGLLLPLFFDGGKLSEAEQLARAVLENGSTFAYAHFVLGRAEMLRGNIQSASNHFDKARAGFSPEEQDKLLLSTLVFSAQTKKLLNQPEEALAELKQALELDPGIAETRVLLSDLLLERQKPEEGGALLEQGLKDQPDQPELLRAMSVFYLRTGRSAEALDWAEQALKADAKAVTGPLCFAFLSLGRPEDAASMADMALKYDSGQPYPFFVQARIAHYKKDYAQARASFNKTLEKISDYPDPRLYADTLFFLGDTEASLGDPNRALPYFQKAVEVDPRSPRNQLTLTTFFGRLGEKEQAQAVADRWLTQFPGKRNYELASKTLADLGYSEKAAEYQKKAESFSQ